MMNRMEQKANIFNIQKYNLYDGPGVRTLIFFQGCPLRCKWCSNPEGLERRPRLMFKAASCINCAACVVACPQGIHKLNEQGNHVIDWQWSNTCTGCGACVSACMQNALSIVGETKPVSELVDISEEERNLFFRDVATAANAIHKAFHPDKVNYGAYGDGGCHLHFHLVPKYKDAFEWGTPFDMNPGKTYLTEEEYAAMIRKIKENL